MAPSVRQLYKIAVLWPSGGSENYVFFFETQW